MRRTTRAPRSPAEVTITLSRDERDALHPELTFGLYGAAPDLGSREQAIDYRARLDLVIRLHDALGWSCDDGRRRFSVTADPGALRRWLTDVRGAAERAVCDEHRALHDLLDDDHGGRGWDRATAAREARAVIDGDLETIHACDAVLKRLPAEDAPLEPRWRLRPGRVAEESAAR